MIKQIHDISTVIDIDRDTLFAVDTEKDGEYVTMNMSLGQIQDSITTRQRGYSPDYFDTEIYILSTTLDGSYRKDDQYIMMARPFECDTRVFYNLKDSSGTGWYSVNECYSWWGIVNWHLDEGFYDYDDEMRERVLSSVILPRYANDNILGLYKNENGYVRAKRFIPIEYANYYHADEYSYQVRIDRLYPGTPAFNQKVEPAMLSNYIDVKAGCTLVYCNQRDVNESNNSFVFMFSKLK